jgi:hypothetical protein
MDLEANASFDSNHDSSTDRHEAKKLQFTTKQRMDMYAFCVLELELHGNTVSIKKQQQAIQKALKKENGQADKSVICLPAGSSTTNSNGIVARNEHQSDHHEQQQQQQEMSSNHSTCHNPTNMPNSQSEKLNSSPQSKPETNAQHSNSLSLQQQQQSVTGQSGSGLVVYRGKDRLFIAAKDVEAADKKTLLQLQEEISKTQRCYSDYQKTQVLTTQMLREVQRRFALYYPDTHCPSRTTIKSVFLKCVANGTVENVKNPRKPTKIPNGDQIEQFLTEEPQMSLREMAKKLNVSTGTVSRRCRALGIIPESVTLKHQQMAMAKRQKQLKPTKQSTGKTKNPVKRDSAGSSRQQQASLARQEQTQYMNGLV